MIDKIREWTSQHVKLTVLIVIVGVLVLFFGTAIYNRSRGLQDNGEAIETSSSSSNTVTGTSGSTDYAEGAVDISNQSQADEGSDEEIYQNQQYYIKRFGKLPKGYLWDDDGGVLSQGDKTKSAQDVVYIYLNALRNGEMNNVQKYTRRSSVLKTYSGFYDSQNNTGTTTETFQRDMYRLMLRSIIVNNIDDADVFADNKRVYTISLNVLDLTDKTFFLDDIAEIYNEITTANKVEGDFTKTNQYLNEYVLNYYQSSKAKRRDVTVSLTLQKYPDINTGWLVSIDSDLDSICKYEDGVLVTNYIKNLYSEDYNDGVWNSEDQTWKYAYETGQIDKDGNLITKEEYERSTAGAVISDSETEREQKANENVITSSYGSEFNEPLEEPTTKEEGSKE